MSKETQSKVVHLPLFISSIILQTEVLVALPLTIKKAAISDPIINTITRINKILKRNFCLYYCLLKVIK